MERICIYPKDVQIVTGKSERWGRDVIKRIKKQFSKEEHQLVTVDEFCNYMSLDAISVKELLRN
jgi:hypothetical protein